MERQIIECHLQKDHRCHVINTHGVRIIVQEDDRTGGIQICVPEGLQFEVGRDLLNGNSMEILVAKAGYL